MSTWVTYREAAELLDGVHVSYVGKLVKAGRLRSRHRYRGGSLNRRQVIALARQLEDERRARAAAAAAPKARSRVNHRPDAEHEWLRPSQVAHLVGITRPGVMRRIHRGRLPAVENHGTYWVRYDLLEMVERARLASKTRIP